MCVCLFVDFNGRLFEGSVLKSSTMMVCVFERERESVCVNVCVCVRL